MKLVSVWNLENANKHFFFVFICSDAKLCPTLCDPMNCSTPGFPVLHNLLKFAQYLHLNPPIPTLPGYTCTFSLIKFCGGQKLFCFLFSHSN